jgi:flagellar biogenesis protein FliO
VDVIQQCLALVLVFGILGGAVWLLRSRQLPSIRMRGERRMQVIERVSLTSNHTLCLVKMGGRLMMIATAPSSCHLIETVEDKIA